MAAFGQKIGLLMGLLRGDTAYVGPFYVTVDITRRCNLQCIGCRFHSPMSKKSPFMDDAVTDIPFDLFKTLCDELQRMGTNSILLTGEGEPLLHPRIFDMISVAKEAGLHVILFTNGTLFDETRIQSLLDSCPDTLRVSLWASSPKEYEKNCPGSDPATFIKTMEGLKLLTQFKADRKSKVPSVILHHPINRNNFEKVNDMVDLAYQAGCNALTFSPLKCWWGSLGSVSLSQTEEKLLLCSLTQMKEKLDSFSLEHNIGNTVLRYKIGYAVWKKMPCYIAWLHVRVRVNGKVLPCHRYALPMGNLNEERLQEIWNNSAFRAFRTKTMTRTGLTSIAEHCDCNFCGFIHDNMQVHRVFKWFSPFALMNRGKERTRQRN
jgi:radical SAM protein with 4Fe4S-binding SPASM domain